MNRTSPILEQTNQELIVDEEYLVHLTLPIHLRFSAEGSLRPRVALQHSLCLHRFEHELRQLCLTQKTSVAAYASLWNCMLALLLWCLR